MYRVAQCNGSRTHLLVCAALAVLIAGCDTASPPFEYIQLLDAETAAVTNTPFSSAIKVRSGNIVFLSGTVGAGPHSHPHVPAEFDHLDFSTEAQTERVMENLKAMVEAAGGQLTDIIQVTRFVRDVGSNQDGINVVMNRYWGPDHRPTSTTVEIVRLATDPRFILEVEAVAVVPD